MPKQTPIGGLTKCNRRLRTIPDELGQYFKTRKEAERSVVRRPLTHMPRGAFDLTQVTSNQIQSNTKYDQISDVAGPCGWCRVGRDDLVPPPPATVTVMGM